MRTDKKLWRNRKARKELARRLRSENPGLEVVHPHAAGIDVGNSAHYVAVRPDRDVQSVRRFECFTADLHRLAEWLHSCGVKTVALQSTGVYWIPLYDILEERGFEVYLVNAQHTKNLPGRKSDVQESQWLLKLHTYGLLNNSFQPPSKIRTLRTYWRQRLQHVTGAATCVQRMQKALTQMNIQLANVISDLSGVTGQMIVRAIIDGERDPWKLAELSHPRIQASRAEIAKSLEGTWRPELIFVLQQEFEMYDTYQRRMAECDQQLQKHLAGFANIVPPEATENIPPRKKKKQNKNNPHFHLADELQRISGVDLTRIDGVDVFVAQTVISEVLTCAATALRASEILALRWSDLLWNEGRIRISKRWAKGKDGETKTEASDGYVPLHPILAAHLRSWRTQNLYSKDADFVFPSLRARGRVPLSASVFVADHLRPAAKKAGVPIEDGQRFGLHNLRHSLSNWMVNKAKVEPKTVQGILRHAKIQTTLDLYTQEDGDETLAAQGEYLAAPGVATQLVQ